VKINWSVNVQVADGPTIAASDSYDAQAFDKIEANVPGQTGSGSSATAGTATVDLQPGGDGKVKLLLIKSDFYDAKLSYKCKTTDAGKPDGPVIALDSLQLLMGSGALGLLNPAPNRLQFTNGTAIPANIQVLVGREAVV